MTELQPYKHEQRVKNFLRTKQLPIKYLDYDNVVIYTKAKQTVNLNIISQKDKKILNKFTKNWVIAKGDVKPSYVKRVSGMIKHYAYKMQNLALRNARLQRKNNLKLSKA